jgi:hypothetical protein
MEDFIKMNYDRRDLKSRKQYNDVYKCLYNCDQFKVCERYVYNKRTDNCLWHDVIEADKNKIGTDKKLTFPILEIILQKKEVLN